MNESVDAGTVGRHEFANQLAAAALEIDQDANAEQSSVVTVIVFLIAVALIFRWSGGVAPAY